MVENATRKNITAQDILEAGKARPLESFEFFSKPAMVRGIAIGAREQHKELTRVDMRSLKQLALQCVNEIERLHKTPDILENPPEDIDVVWVIAAPGQLLTHGSKPGWSAQFPWLDNCEREVVGKGINLVHAVTAKRIGKPVSSVVKKDVLQSGPWTVYNMADHESGPVKIMLRSPQVRIPEGKVYIYQEFHDNGGARVIRTTADQAESIHMPPGIVPRKIAICVLAAQWVRLGRLLAKAQTLPQEAQVIVVPVPSPEGHETEHAIMESRGAIINAFKNGKALKKPINYST